jgi:hypothetical protein
LASRTAASRLLRSIAAGVCLCALVAGAASAEERASAANKRAIGITGVEFETFLDRLMRAESNGRDWAANPRSSALGPFQFIKTTFLELARRHFGAEIATLADEEILVLRTDRDFARRAATLYSMENLAHLIEQGLTPTLGHLRLAFLVGASGAARLLQAEPQSAASDILGGPVIRANPFMTNMTASDLIARAARDVSDPGLAIAGAPRPRVRTAAVRPGPIIVPRPPALEPPAGITVRCNQKLVVCRRWIVMQINKQRVAQLAAQAPLKGQRRVVPSRPPNRPGV